MYSWHSMQGWTLNVLESSSFPGKWKAIMLCRRGKSWQSSAKPFPSPDAPWVGIKLTGRVPLPNRAFSLVESHALLPHWSAALTKSHSVKERRDRAMVVVFKEAKRREVSVKEASRRQPLSLIAEERLDDQWDGQWTSAVILWLLEAPIVISDCQTSLLH